MFPISRRDLLKQSFAAGVGASCLGSCFVRGAEPKEPLSIGSRRQLFLDDLVIAEMKNLERTWHHAERMPEPVLVADRPHEFGAIMIFPGDVLYDDQERMFKMWYCGVEWPAPYQVCKYHLCYATSKDGIQWKKPTLGHVRFKGSTDNNLMFDSIASQARPEHVWNYRAVLKDPHDPDPSRRYKAIGFGGTFPWDGSSPFWGIHVAFSPDGLHWTDCKTNPVLRSVSDDGAFSLGWDDALGKYVMYVRAAQTPRQAGVCFSDDFVHWTDPKIVLGPGPEDPKDLEIYGLGARKYQDLYIGSVLVYRTAEHLAVNPGYCEIGVSRDGIRWVRPAPGKYFLTPGAPGEFDDCVVYACTPLEVGDEIFFYYSGCDYPHNIGLLTGSPSSAVGLARMRRDGFVSLDSRMNDGSEMTTVPLRCDGKPLVVNVRAKRGSIKAAVLAQDGTAIPGFGHQECNAFVGDAVNHRVVWAGGRTLAELEGRAVRLRFQIRNAEMYSFGFST